MSPARVQIVVEAKDASAGVFRALTSQMGAFGGLVEELTGKNVNWGNVAQQATQMVINGIKDAMKVTTEYAKDVRDLSAITGTGAEETSRLLQVLDDFEISAEDVGAAVRKMTQQGLVPNIDTLAKLSDEYLSINDAQERNQFILDNLGRSGMQWVNVLKAGGSELRKMNGEVSDSLILTEEQIQKSEEYRLALDTMNDRIMGLKVSLGNSLIPTFIHFMDVLNKSAAVLDRFPGLIDDTTQQIQEAQSAADLATIAFDAWSASQQGMIAMALPSFLRDMVFVQQDVAGAATEASAAFREEEASMATLGGRSMVTAEELKAVDEGHKTFLDTLGSVVEAQTTYYDGLKNVNQQLASGNITTEEHAAAVDRLAADYQQASADIVMSIIEMKLAQDGWTDAELSAYLKIGKAQGKFTEDQVKMAEGAIQSADDIVAGYDNMGDQIYHTGKRAEDASVDLGIMSDSALELADAGYEAAGGVGATKSQINGLPPSGSAWEYFFNIITKGRVPALPYNTTSSNASLDELREETGGGRQQGGEVFAGMPTRVGEGGSEMFMPSQNGRILGHAESLHAMSLGGGGGTNYFYGNVTIMSDADTGSDLMSIR